jgi:hypothetical protein
VKECAALLLLSDVHCQIDNWVGVRLSRFYTCLAPELVLRMRLKLRAGIIMASSNTLKQALDEKYKTLNSSKEFSRDTCV